MNAGGRVGGLFQIRHIADSKSDLVLLAIKDHSAF